MSSSPERDPAVWAVLRDIRCHSSTKVIKAALVGNDREKHIFALTRSPDMHAFYQTKSEDFDEKLEGAVAALTVKVDRDIPALPRAGPNTSRSMLLRSMCMQPSMAFWARI